MPEEKEKIFPQGLIYKAPRETAPDHFNGSLSIKVDEFINFLREHEDNGWVNIDLKTSKSNKFYSELNTWKPEPRPQQEITEQEIPQF